MSNEFNAFATRITRDPREFARELGKMFLGGQGPAAAELLNQIVANQKSRFAVDLGNLIAIHLRRSHRELVIRQLNGDKSE